MTRSRVDPGHAEALSNVGIGAGTGLVVMSGAILLGMTFHPLPALIIGAWITAGAAVLPKVVKRLGYVDA